jgi:hypothetical protein
VLSQLGWDEYPRLETVFADAAYQGTLEDFATEELGLWLQVVPKLEGRTRSWCCRNGGLLSARSPGLGATGASARITRPIPEAAWPGFTPR